MKEQKQLMCDVDLQTQKLPYFSQLSLFSGCVIAKYFSSIDLMCTDIASWQTGRSCLLQTHYDVQGVCMLYNYKATAIYQLAAQLIISVVLIAPFVNISDTKQLGIASYDAKFTSWYQYLLFPNLISMCVSLTI